ncbi:DUF4180 domain-containing protein [Patulibacter defluvii]|uniref:DUF4180 domain-containing protein n=1 Tax=Patulibacter defluvii TaxID=3095358 RepID=UPI002A747976|nr:DUF4180 domain-containing protein [Patulibacter sp. DM4]
MRIEDRAGHRLLHLDEDGPAIGSGPSVADLIGDAWAHEADLIVLPVARLDPAFFDLRSGWAGELTQKLTNYRLRLAIVGDVDGHAAASGAFRDYRGEANRGGHVWFVPDLAALDARLGEGGGA